MITILLIAILLTLLFGAAWLKGLLRNVALFAAFAVLLGLLKEIGVSQSTAIYSFGVVMGLGCLASWYLIDKPMREQKRKIEEKRRSNRAERYRQEQEAKNERLSANR